MAQPMLGDDVRQLSAIVMGADDGPARATGMVSDLPATTGRFLPSALSEKSVTVTVSETGLLKEDSWIPSPWYPAVT